MKFLLENVKERVFSLGRKIFFCCLGSRGVKSAYTAQEFRRFFRTGFGQDLVKEKNLSRTVEIFLDEREQSFALFEYAVDLINEVTFLFNEIGHFRTSINV